MMSVRGPCVLQPSAHAEVLYAPFLTTSVSCPLPCLILDQWCPLQKHNTLIWGAKESGSLNAGRDSLSPGPVGNMKLVPGHCVNLPLVPLIPVESRQQDQIGQLSGCGESAWFLTLWTWTHFRSALVKGEEKAQSNHEVPSPIQAPV